MTRVFQGTNSPIAQRRLIVSFLIASLFCGTIDLQAKDPVDKPEQVSTDQIQTWISELANRSEKPFNERYVLQPPRNIDRDSLKVVKNAYDNLAANIPEAIPFLIESLQDNRYSYYQESPSGAFLNYSVGDACYSIIQRNIEVYKKYATVMDSTDVPRSVHFISKMGGPAKWYASRKDKSLYELQLEATEWALEQPKPSKLVRDADWKRAIEELTAFHERSKAEEKPTDAKVVLWFEGK